ncbi:hypothetical protein GCM10027093_09210 [Paraburkholderia jirisanensis]
MAREDFMRDLTILVRRDTEAMLEEMKDHAIRVWNGDRSDVDTAYFTYPSATQLFDDLTPDRWELVELLQGMGETSLRALARELEQPVRLVAEDVRALLQLELLDRTESGKLYVPYETIRIVFGKGARRPHAELVARAGVLKGRMTVPDDFNTAHADEIRSMFEDGDVFPPSA